MFTLGSKGAALHMMGPDSWVYDDHSGKLFDGKFKAVIQHMVLNGFDIDDLQHAVEEIISKDHDVANFGIYKSFMFSYNRKKEKTYGN